MANKIDTARINADKIDTYNDKTFKELFENKGVTFFGEKKFMDKLKYRAEKLGLIK